MKVKDKKTKKLRLEKAYQLANIHTSVQKSNSIESNSLHYIMGYRYNTQSKRLG
ncbi:MAG: hypothetical protein VX112_00390 [Pseudomonadota bacterium]|nr:hypothetical protein [Pseudomonadota bacterium]